MESKEKVCIHDIRETLTLPGRSPDGSSPDGSSPDGSSPDGSSPDGSPPDGSSPDGSSPDGNSPGNNINEASDSGIPDDDICVSESVFEPLYEGADITVCGTFCAIMEYKRACRLPFTAIEKLLDLLKLVCPPNNGLPRSVHVLKSFFQKYSTKETKRKFCPECSCEMDGDVECCTSCHGKDFNYLYILKPERAIRNIVTSTYVGLPKVLGLGCT